MIRTLVPMKIISTHRIGLLFAILVATFISACVHNPNSTVSSAEYINNQLIIQTSHDRLTLSSLASGAIEVYQRKNSELEFVSFAKKESLEYRPAQFTQNSKYWILNNRLLMAKVDKTDFSIDFYHEGELITSQLPLNNSKDKRQIQFRLTADEQIMGGGERVLGMDRRGHRMPLYNRAHYGYTTESNQMYFSLPLVISDKKYSILFDNSASGFLDIGKTNKDRLAFEADSGRLGYIVFAENSYPKLIEQYVEVTGRQPLPPRWAFGNFSSRFGYKNQQQVLDTIDQFIAEDIPVDSIILDLYWFGSDIKGFMGNLDWDKESFPQPVKMIEELKSKGVKTILVTEPFILSSSDRWQEALDNEILMSDGEGNVKRFDFYFGNTGLIDVFNDDAANWFGDIYSDLTNQGVAGVWGDLGEPEVHPDDGMHFVSEMNRTSSAKSLHNVYGHQWAKLVNKRLLRDKPNERPFIMMRSGFAGSQRYGMIPWTGDVSRSWDGLKPQVELSLQMGLQGLAYTHSDLGGFAGGETFDKEMYIRWLQYGAFQPVFRPHAQDNIAPEPIFHDQQTKDIVRRYLKLRYKMLPYIYSMAYQNSTTGMPLMRPILFEDESDASLLTRKDSYLWGDSFFIHPIVEPGISEQSVNLPSGTWFDFWTEKAHSGQTKIPVTLNEIPVLVRAGAFVPMVNAQQNTSLYSSEELTLHYYHDDSIKSGQYQMYEDDGHSENSISSGQNEWLNFSSTNTNKSLNIEFSKAGKGYVGAPKERQLALIVHNWAESCGDIHLNDRKLSSAGCHYDSVNRLLTISFDWNHQDLMVSIDKKIVLIAIKNEV
ncbi:MAG: DUF5110 domain-containing protein [Kangiellaceae bacterium]|nr:DUF5110 domain-containing protein [Kangiellaceae bacterium]